MNLLRLVRILVFRNIREDKFLTVLSILGIALGIGLFTGVKVASDRAIASFESDVQGVVPFTNYEITDSSGVDFNEKIYKKIRETEADSLPLLKTYGYLPEFSEAIDINGIFTAKALQSLKFSALKPSSGNSYAGKSLFDIYNFDDFYREQNSVLITGNFARKHSLKKGDTFKVLVYDREYALKIADIIASEILITNTAVMDIGNFQEYFGKTGYLTKIELATDEVRAGIIQSILPSNLRIEKKEDIFRNQKAMIRSFRYNLQFVSLIAILVGIFLLYNTVFISVVKRRTEIGIMRGLGMDRKTVIVLFSLQGIILGTSGSVLGIFFGQIAAYFSVIAVEKTISTMYTAVTLADYKITGMDAAVSFALGFTVSFIASLIPAYEASAIKPNESSREGSFEKRYVKYHKWFSLAGIFSILTGLAAAYIDYLYAPFSFPAPAYAGIIMLIIGFTLVSPFYFIIVLRLIRKPLEKIFGPVGKITAADMQGSIHRFSVALMSVTVSSALIIAFLTIIFSFRTSLNNWIHKNITADVYIKPASCKTNYCFYPVSGKVIDTVAAFPEVADVDRFRAMQLELNGGKIIAGFADIKIKKNHMYKRYADAAYEKTLEEMEGDEPVAGISDFLSIKYGLKEGDKVTLNSPDGPVTFRINDVFSSYSTTSGFIYIDRKWLKKYWVLDDATQFSIYLKDGADAALFIKKVHETLSADYSLEVMNNQELRNKIIDIFNRTFSITYAIELISIAVSLIGIINTLLALVFERKREISIIRYLGGNWRQIRNSLLLSAGTIGLAGILFSSMLGPLMSIILIEVVNKVSFGWKIYFRIPYHYIAAVSALLFLTTLLAGLIPSGVAKKIDPKRFITFE